MSITIEALDNILDDERIDRLPSPPPAAEYFDRNRWFSIHSQTYRIEWWKNLCYLHFGPAFLIFDGIEKSRSWPGTPGWDLRLTSNEQLICIIPLEGNRT